VARSRTGRTIAKVLSSPVGVGGSKYHYCDRAGEVDHVPFGAYPAALLRRLGGWDETIPVNQDYELDFRVRAAGRRILLDPSARIDWQCRETVPRLLHQYHRYGQGKAQVLLRHPRSAKARHVLPGLLVAVLAGSMCAAAMVRSPAPLLTVPAYALGCGGLALAVGDLEPRERPTAAAAIMAMQVGYGLGLFRGAVARLAGRIGAVSPSQVGGLSRPGG
jgi:hypothetical protein